VTLSVVEKDGGGWEVQEVVAARQYTLQEMRLLAKVAGFQVGHGACLWDCKQPVLAAGGVHSMHLLISGIAVTLFDAQPPRHDVSSEVRVVTVQRVEPGVVTRHTASAETAILRFCDSAIQRFCDSAGAACGTLGVLAARRRSCALCACGRPASALLTPCSRASARITFVCTHTATLPMKSCQTGRDS
jgi:hypothetical protein